MKLFLLSFLSLLFLAAVSTTTAQLTCSTADDCTEGRPVCCGGFCLGCCTDDDCPEGRSCKPDGTCLLSCFSGESFLDVLGKGPVPMKEAQVGDRVRSADGAYDTVYAFGHREPETEGYFLQLHLADNIMPALEITTDHLLLQAGHDHPVPASTIQVGDALVLADGTTAVVDKIAGVTRTGIYAPLSTSGLIAVNNVVASNYVTAQIDTGYVTMLGRRLALPITWHWVSHAFQAPHRMWCQLMTCESSMNEGENVKPFQVDLLDWVTFYTSSKRSALIQYVVVPIAVLPTIMVLAAFQIVEYGVKHPLALLSTLAALIVIGTQRKNKSSHQKV